jgi:hypothetical protein
VIYALNLVVLCNLVAGREGQGDMACEGGPARASIIQMPILQESTGSPRRAHLPCLPAGRASSATPAVTVTGRERDARRRTWDEDELHMQPLAVVLCAFTARRPARPAGSVLGGGGSGPMRRQFYRGWGSDVRRPACPEMNGWTPCTCLSARLVDCTVPWMDRARLRGNIVLGAWG